MGREPVTDLAGAMDGLPRSLPDPPELVAAAATAAGLGALASQPVSLAEVAETPRAVAESIERRTWSSLWQLDAEQWRDRVEPAVARLRALPDQDRPRPGG